MKLYFVRHGETDWNKQRRIQGRTDIPLNEFGIHLAKETARGLKDVPFTVCYSSPLKRARDTAEIILGDRQVPVITDWRIVEMCFGEYEGKSRLEKEYELPDNYQYFLDSPEQYKAPLDGEDFAEVRQRTGEFLKELYGKEEYKDSSILITTHGAALAGILNNIKNQPISRYWGKGVHKNCGVTEVLVSGGIPEIISENVVYYKDKVVSWEETEGTLK